MRTKPDIDSFVDANGVRLRYTEWNPDGGDTTLLVHGLNTQLHTWDPIVPELAETRRVLCVDLRGHGRSSWPLDGYRLESFAADLVAMLEVLGIDELQYVGHSLGGRAGMIFAATWPGRLRHFLISDASVQRPYEQGLKLREMGLARPRFFDSREEALDYLRSVQPAWQDEFHLSAIENQYRVNWIGKVVPRADPELRWMYEGMLTPDPGIWDYWSRITCPITLLWGTESPMLTQEIVDRMQKEQPEMTVYRPKGGHWYLREDPEEFLRFARKVLAPVSDQGS